MAWSDDGMKERADAVAALFDEVSLHTGDPGSSGTANEWSGGGYARQSPSYDAATIDGSTAVASLSSAMSFTGPANEDAAYVGLWGTGSVFLGSVARSGGDASANAAGEYNVTKLDVTATGDIVAS
ncbi:MAG: hypothetical protein ACLFRV_03945 [Acidimicrobiales bacterium]